jgi:hypothetical protein
MNVEANVVLPLHLALILALKQESLPAQAKNKQVAQYLWIALDSA